MNCISKWDLVKSAVYALSGRWKVNQNSHPKGNRGNRWYLILSALHSWNLISTFCTKAFKGMSSFSQNSSTSVFLYLLLKQTNKVFTTILPSVNPLSFSMACPCIHSQVKRSVFCFCFVSWCFVVVVVCLFVCLFVCFDNAYLPTHTFLVPACCWLKNILIQHCEVDG